MKKLYGFTLLFIIGALLMAACAGGAAPVPSGGGQPAPNSGSTTSKATEAPSQPAQSQPSASQPTAESSSGNTTSGTDVLDLPDVTEGLNALDSYATTFVMSFDGKENDQAKQATCEMEESYIKNPPAKHTIVKGNCTSLSAASQSDNFELIEVGGKSYTRVDEFCSSLDSKDAPTVNSAFAPSSIIGDIKGAQLLGTETVNGVPAQHYAVDVGWMTSLGYTNGKSEVWVAQQGNFIVKYLFEATGKDTYFGVDSNTEGTLRWAYELKSANQPITIEPPADCGGAANDIPIMSDATNKSGFEGLTTYTTASAFDDVVQFYKRDMVANGWSEQEGNMSADGFAVLSFAKENRMASVTIRLEDDKTTMVLITTQEQK